MVDIKYRLIACLLMVFLCSPLWAVKPYQPEFVNPFEEPWRFRTFSELEGKGAACLGEDADGHMWFGVVDGAMRFDGIDWQLFTQKDGLFPGPVRVFHKTEDGRFYAGSDYGLCRYVSGRWEPVYPVDGKQPRMVIKDIVSDQNGVVWVASSWGLLRLDKDQYVLFTTPQLGQEIQAHDGHMTVHFLPDDVMPRIVSKSGIGVVLTGGFSEQYLVVYPPVTIHALSPNGLAVQAGLKVGDQIRNLDRSDALDGLTKAVTLEIQRKGISEAFEVSLEPAQVDDRVQVFEPYSLAVAPDGSLWVGLYSGEVAHLTFDAGKKDQIVSTRLFTQHDFITGFGPRILVRKNGHVWLVNESYESHVQVFDGTTWKPVANYDGRLTNFSIFETRQGAVFIGGVSAFWIYDRGMWQNIIYNIDGIDLPSSRPQFYETQSGVVWMLGLGQSAYRMDYFSDRWTTFINITYECEDQNGHQWFRGYVGEEVCVVKKSGDTWVSYGLEDGLINDLSGVRFAQDRVWAMGSHYGVAAVAWLENDTWHKKLFPRLGNEIHQGGYVAPDGTLWLGAHPNFDSDLGQLGGVLQLKPGQDPENDWAHFTPPDAPVSVYGAGQASDGMVWFAYGHGVRGFDGQTWHLPEPLPLRNSSVDGIEVGPMGDLYFLSRSYGVFHLKEGIWKNYTTKDGLPDNTIRTGLALDGGRLVVKTANSTAGFDQGQWRQDIYPAKIRLEQMLKSKDGFWWFVKHGQPSVPRSSRYRPDKEAPVVRFVQAPTEVSSDGNTFITWRGMDPWRISPEDKLDYAYRLNDDPWGAYTEKKEAILVSLSPGDYRFEVKARDQDFNETTIPAMIHFTVAPPTWREPWFLALCFGFLVLITSQTMRVIRRDQKLQVANQTLEKQVEEIREAQRETEQARQEAEMANQAKSTFLANMSHEIRTPMNAILGYAQILNSDSTLNPEHKRAIQTIGQSGEHLLGLINDILDISKIEAGHEQLTLTDFDLKVMLDGLGNMFEMRCRQKNLQWQLKSEVRDGWVHGDENKLRQVLINLVGNAVKFTDRGSVVLTVLVQENDHYCFEVTDTGQGISKDKQAVIFEPFQQDAAGVKHGGTGLGLAISLRHVEMMGGTMALTSVEGEGSTFSFAVALTPGKDAQKQDATDWSLVSHLAKGQTVSALVVDDVANNVDILANLLTKIGVQVRTADSGQEALDALRESMPDIVFSDIRMPNMDGSELLKCILDAYGKRAPKMIATTASVFEHQRQEYLDLGFDAFVNKPIQFEDVYACMAQQLGVTYAFVEKDETVSEPQAETDLKNVVLPAQLLNDLKKAVEDASITDLRTHVQTLSEMENMHALVLLVRERLQGYDFDGIREILDDVESA